MKPVVYIPEVESQRGQKRLHSNVDTLFED
jgi:hypothetical protein